MSFPGFVWTPAVVSPRERPQDMMHPSSHRLWLGHPYPTNPWSSITSPESSPWWLTPSWTTMLTGEFYSFLHTHQLHGGFTYAGSKWCRVHAAHHGHWLCHLQKVVTWMPQRLRTVDINHSWVSDFYWKIESCLCAFFITRFPQRWASWIRPMHHLIPFLQSCQLGHWDSSTNKHFWEDLCVLEIAIKLYSPRCHWRQEEMDNSFPGILRREASSFWYDWN